MAENSGQPVVVCAGILVADTFMPPLLEMPMPGQLVAVSQPLHQAGGCAVNTAVALNKLGVNTAVAGKVLYRAPGSPKWVEVAKNLNYANGIGTSPDQKTLYVSETVWNAVLKFTVNDDGSLSHRANFALLNLLTPNKNDSWWLGPTV